MVDQHLAELYQVEPRSLLQAVKRNIGRFPEDFMFQLTAEEAKVMRSQFVIAPKRNIRYRPYVFTEQGVAMLSSVLRSKRAVAVNILIIRVFVRLREILASHKDLANKIDALERKYESHEVQIRVVFDTIRKLRGKSRRSKKPQIGFTSSSANRTSH